MNCKESADGVPEFDPSLSAAYKPQGSPKQDAAGVNLPDGARR